uniref:Uncharacterized protein n=1 Tax=Cacopsylla melanoneura TaxID=428564 RepID=A0A8D8XAV1_9HEMI
MRETEIIGKEREIGGGDEGKGRREDAEGAGWGRKRKIDRTPAASYTHAAFSPAQGRPILSLSPPNTIMFKSSGEFLEIIFFNFSFQSRTTSQSSSKITNVVIQ